MFNFQQVRKINLFCVFLGIKITFVPCQYFQLDDFG